MSGSGRVDFATLVVVAAGRGSRFGESGKVLAQAGGRPLLAWSLLAARDATSVRDAIVVAGSHTRVAIEDLIGGLGLEMDIRVVTGGKTRRESVAAGIDAGDDVSDVVLVHDAARPLVTPAFMDACAEKALETGAAIVATPVTDTLKQVADGTILRTLDREALWAAQTPQGFRRALLHDAAVRTRDVRGPVTDDASLFEALEIPVTIVAGSPMNMKVTHRDDLAIVDALLRARTNGELAS